MLKIKLYFLFFSIVLFLIIPFMAYATEEISIDKFYINSMKILFRYYPSTINYHEKWPDLHIAIDYSVEIIKSKPESLEAYFVINAIGQQINWGNDPIFKEKYIKIRDRILDNPLEKTNIAESIIYLRCAFMMGDELMDPPTNDTVRRCVESLEKIYKYYHEPNYATLALIALCFGANDKYYNEFINKYPKHVAIPYVFLGMQFKKYLNGEYDAHIKEIKNLMEKYKNIKSPEGWDYALDCSHDLIWTYCKLNDIENAQKYLKLIEEKAPDYYFLENLKSMINVTK